MDLRSIKFESWKWGGANILKNSGETKVVVMELWGQGDSMTVLMKYAKS